jgi:hypothetical protein
MIEALAQATWQRLAYIHGPPTRVLSAIAVINRSRAIVGSKPQRILRGLTKRLRVMTRQDFPSHVSIAEGTSSFANQIWKSESSFSKGQVKTSSVVVGEGCSKIPSVRNTPGVR